MFVSHPFALLLLSLCEFIQAHSDGTEEALHHPIIRKFFQDVDLHFPIRMVSICRRVVIVFVTAAIVIIVILVLVVVINVVVVGVTVVALVAMGASINCTEAALVHVAVHHVIGVCNVGVLDRSWLGVWVLLLVSNDHLWDRPDVARAVVPVTVPRLI